MKIEIYFNKKVIDITQFIDPNFQIIRRCDEAFDTGTMNGLLDINTNITPFTKMKITDGNNIEYWYCSSVCKKYPSIENLYAHTISLIEVTSILSAYQLGSKAFSRTNDYTKISILKTLCTDKYRVTIPYNSNRYMAFKECHDYTFGPGTTYFDAFLEISKDYDAIPRCTLESLIEDRLYLDFDLLNSNNTEYSLENITDATYDQIADDYGANLEAEVENVVDRNQITSINGLSCRSDGVEFSYDTCMLEVPTKIESVEKLEVLPKKVVQTFSILTIPGEFLSIYRKGFSSSYGWNYEFGASSKTLLDWVMTSHYPNSSIITDGPIYKIICNFVLGHEDTEFEDLIWESNLIISSGKSYTNSSNQIDWYFDLKIDNSKPNQYTGKYINISDLLLEKNQYDLLEDCLKPKYCFYEKGQSYIEGLNTNYNNDFWNQLTGSAVHSFTDFFTYVSKNGTDENNIFVSYGLSVLIQEPNDCLFNISYYPITDIYLNSNKGDGSLNLSRNYKANSSQSTIDYDRMIKSANTYNKILGLKELSIEIISDITPKPSQYVMYDDKKWYIVSVQSDYSNFYKTHILNCTSHYSKVCEAVGVPTQYNSTKNPLENIIDRLIEIKSNSEVSISDDMFIRFEFYKSSIDPIGTYIKPIVLMSNDNEVTGIVEMLNQYSIARKLNPVEGGKYSCTDVGYVDSNNEALLVKTSLVKDLNMSKDNSFNMPIYNDTYTSILDFPDKILYKDARERLIFNFKFKKIGG